MVRMVSMDGGETRLRCRGLGVLQDPERGGWPGLLGEVLAILRKGRGKPLTLDRLADLLRDGPTRVQPAALVAALRNGYRKRLIRLDWSGRRLAFALAR